MIRKSLVLGTFSILLAVFVYWGTSSGAKDCGGIPAERVADMVHAVIESHRTVYTVDIVERMQAKGIVVVAENWRSANTLPLPVQLLQESARLAVSSPAKVGYKLIGLWPINKQNGPKTEFEQKGLVETLRKPHRPYTEVVMHGGDSYLQAMYADRAVSQACIGCHNAHPDSPKQNFKQKDVMGAMVVTVPFSQKDCGDIPAERVADMVHAVIESHRTVYTVDIVERMQAKGIVVAAENWRSANTLPLPVQFLQESARLAVNTPAKVGYKLIGLWPINKQNGPKTEFEQKGLWETLQNPDRPYIEVVMRGGSYLQAMYADRAVSQACIGCHNAHPDSPKRDFQQNDVMGAIMVTVPLSR
jgi:hypothetical protein